MLSSFVLLRALTEFFMDTVIWFHMGGIKIRSSIHLDIFPFSLRVSEKTNIKGPSFIFCRSAKSFLRNVCCLCFTKALRDASPNSARHKLFAVVVLMPIKALIPPMYIVFMTTQLAPEPRFTACQYNVL